MIHETIRQFYSPENNWYRSRLDFPINTSQAVLESIVGRYLIYCYMTNVYDNVPHILSTLQFIGGLIPRLIIRESMENVIKGIMEKDKALYDVIYMMFDWERRRVAFLNYMERKKNLWVSEKDSEGKVCAIRMDSGQGQAPIACMGLWLVKSPLGDDWATRIAKAKYQIQFYGKQVPQGNMLSYWPVPMVGMLEVLALSEISGVSITFMQKPRVALSLAKCFPWDKPNHRSLCLWFLATINPRKYRDKFDAWIKTRDADMLLLEQKYNSIKDNIKDSNYLTDILDKLIGDELRK